MTRFCIYCGKEETPDNPIVNGICLRCRIKRGMLIRLKKDEFHIEICKICYSVKIGYKWIETSGFEEALNIIVREVIANNIEASEGVEYYEVAGYELLSKASWRTFLKINVRAIFKGIEVNVPLSATVFLKPVKCPRCIMYDSREFEAVLQIRGYFREQIEKAINKELNRNHRLIQDLVDIIVTDNGVDIYFYTHGAARKLARRLARILGAVARESFEEAGMRSGKQRARLYISLKPKA